MTDLDHSLSNKIFLSHASFDAPLARYLRDMIQLSFGVEFFMLPDDAPEGVSWLEQVREAARQCRELISLITPESNQRPWIAAEWACFWLSQRRTTPITVGISSADIWEPMRAYQAVKLEDSGSVVRWLSRVASESRKKPAEGVRGLALEVSNEVPRIRREQRIGDVEGALARLAINIRSGSDNISPTDVEALLRADMLTEILDLTTVPAAGQVKLRQLASVLVNGGRLGEAGIIAERMANRSEIKNIGLAVLEIMPRGATSESEEWALLEKLHPLIGTEQILQLLRKMDDVGVAPQGSYV